MPGPGVGVCSWGVPGQGVYLVQRGALSGGRLVGGCAWSGAGGGDITFATSLRTVINSVHIQSNPLLDKMMSRNQRENGVQERHLMFKGLKQLNYNVLVFYAFICNADVSVCIMNRTSPLMEKDLVLHSV